jgi:glycerophosphoryl diester phosphodiesterase
LRDRWPIVSTHLVYTVAGLVVLFPFIGLVARTALALSGKTALTNLDILFFVLTPLGAVTLILLGTLLVFVLAFEHAALLTIIGTRRKASAGGLPTVARGSIATESTVRLTSCTCLST